MDVKVGNGAFSTEAFGRHAGAQPGRGGGGLGPATQALISDMNQVLGSTAGNAVEVREAIDFTHRRGASHACCS